MPSIREFSGTVYGYAGYKASDSTFRQISLEADIDTIYKHIGRLGT